MQIVRTCPMIWDDIELFLYRKIETMAYTNGNHIISEKDVETIILTTCLRIMSVVRGINTFTLGEYAIYYR